MIKRREPRYLVFEVIDLVTQPLSNAFSVQSVLFPQKLEIDFACATHISFTLHIDTTGWPESLLQWHYRISVALHYPHIIWSVSMFFHVEGWISQMQYLTTIFRSWRFVSRSWEIFSFKMPYSELSLVVESGLRGRLPYQILVQSIVHWMCYCDILELGEHNVSVYRLAAGCMLVQDPSHAVTKRTASEACSDMPCDWHFR
jgi:hypothetical protein